MKFGWRNVPVIREMYKFFSISIVITDTVFQKLLNPILSWNFGHMWWWIYYNYQWTILKSRLKLIFYVILWGHVNSTMHYGPGSLYSSSSSLKFSWFPALRSRCLALFFLFSFECTFAVWYFLLMDHREMFEQLVALNDSMWFYLYILHCISLSNKLLSRSILNIFYHPMWLWNSSYFCFIPPMVAILMYIWNPPAGCINLDRPWYKSCLCRKTFSWNVKLFQSTFKSCFC